MPEASSMMKRRISRMLSMKTMTMKRTTRRMRKTRTTRRTMRMRKKTMMRMRRSQAHLIIVRDILIGMTWRCT